MIDHLEDVEDWHSSFGESVYEDSLKQSLGIMERMTNHRYPKT